MAKDNSSKKIERPTDTASAWTMIASYLKTNATDVVLSKGAQAADVDAFEKTFAVKLPPAMRETWLRHDGDDESGAIAGWSLMSLDGIASETNFWRGFTSEGEPPSNDARVATTWWDPAWVAFASSGGGDFLVADLSEKGGGQIFYATMDPPERGVVAASFAEWLADYAFALKSGALACEDGEWESAEEYLLKRRD